MNREQLVDFEAAVLTAVERGEVTTAGDMVLAAATDSWARDHVETFPEHVRDRLAGRLAESYAADGAPEEQERVVAVHALMSSGRADDLKASDHMSAVRQRLLDAETEPRWVSSEISRLAWLELLSGRDIPVPLGATIRRYASDGASHGKLREVSRLLVGRHPALNAGEQWSDRVLAELADLPAAWTDLVGYARTVPDGSRPRAAWEEKGRALLARVEGPEFRDRVSRWLALVGCPPTASRARRFLFDPYNYEAARGLLWLLSFLPEHPRTVREIGTVLERALRRVPGVGPGMPKLANACAFVLCGMKEQAALAEVARLTTRVAYKSTLNILETGLKARAEALGIGRDDIEELSVPTYGLSEDGSRSEQLGDSRGELAVEAGRPVLRWRNAAGKAVKSVPAAVRRDHPEQVKELRAAVKDVNATLSAVSRRLERQFLTGRTWPSDVWRERYLGHPLVGTLARRLIWTVDGTACRYSDGAPRDLSGRPVTGEGTVGLWHPVDHPVEEVLAWRELLEEERLTQPFKQAHREVYLLTDAERRTAVYSNRFAGHILRQHPFRSLVAERGWRDELRMALHDLQYPPAVRELPEWDLRTEYWIRGDGRHHEAHTTESGAYELLAADQVRFYPIDAPPHWFSTNDDESFHQGEVAPVPLAEIPAQVLSEVLRDVDLFVSVASVAHDPTWQDGGPDGRHAAYWSRHGTGELSETARTRRDLLTRMLPRLAIGDRCHVDGRFLHVQGTLHTYKIHLGSGNILITPDDRYLCIVPKDVPERSSQVYLPFEGDRALSVILSKAMMLAGDTEITDPTILSQL